MTADFEIVSPEYWQQNAERLIFSSEALIEKLRQIQDFPKEDQNFVQWNNNVRALLEANYMLLGFAVENSIKSYSIYQYILRNGHPKGNDLKYLKKEVWKVKDGHDTLEIAEKASLNLTTDEKLLFQKVREHSVWKGRYHIPNLEADIKQTLLPGEKFTYKPAERKMISEFVNRIGKIIRT